MDIITEKVDSHHGGNSTILGTTLINLLFNTCNSEQLI